MELDRDQVQLLLRNHDECLMMLKVKDG